MSLGVAWPEEVVVRLRGLLDRAHGRREARLLLVHSLQACVEDALGSPWGHAWRHAGEVGDPRAFTTVCLAVVGEREVVVGVAPARAQDVTPSRAWPSLGTWRLHDPPANVAALQRWARARREDRLAVPRVTAPAGREGAALLRRIREAPDDDAARRVYADWLQEREDPRGEFIALQLARPRDEQEALALEARATALLAAHRGDWLGALFTAPATFERGFLQRLSLGVGHAPLAGALLAREPVHTIVAEGAEAARQVVASAWLAQVQGLEVVPGAGALDHERLGLLLASAFLEGLTRLRLAGQPLGDPGARALAQRWPSALPRLEALALEQVEVGPAGLEALLASPGFRRLSTLELVATPLGPEGVAALAAGAGRLQLRRLRLDRVQAGDDGARALAGSARLGGLELLSLREDRIGPRGAAALLQAPGLAGLRGLDLAGNPVGARVERELRARFGPGSPRPPPPW